MRIDILSLFPAMTDALLGESMMKRAQEAGIVQLRSYNIRDWSSGRHHQVDDAPYGGGQGMVMQCAPVFEAVEALRTSLSRVVLMTPSGRRFDQPAARRLAQPESHLIILCGHYEGVDQRIVDHLVDEEISIGDYVLTNGALAAAVVVDAIVRLLPGALGHPRSAEEDSFAQGALEGAQYTRPAEFRGWRVPEVLLSGNHAAIAAWRLAQARAKTAQVRPDLLPPADSA